MNIKLHLALAIVILADAMRDKPEWEYGTAGANATPARRHTKRGNVQFVLWKAGEQGHTEDYWHDFDQSWWPTFKRSNAPT